jgi:hypothetical protein
MPRRLRRASAVELEPDPPWWALLWARWFAKTAQQASLDQCGRWPIASRVIGKRPVLRPRP